MMLSMSSLRLGIKRIIIILMTNEEMADKGKALCIMLKEQGFTPWQAGVVFSCAIGILWNSQHLPSDDKEDFIQGVSDTLRRMLA